jgi:hypothetical protein
MAQYARSLCGTGRRGQERDRLRCRQAATKVWRRELEVRAEVEQHRGWLRLCRLREQAGGGEQDVCEHGVSLWLRGACEPRRRTTEDRGIRHALRHAIDGEGDRAAAGTPPLSLNAEHMARWLPRRANHLLPHATQ